MDASQARGPGRCAATVVLALAGQPNVGKSTVFNLLTGLSQHVGNWPGKTVERKEGTLLRDGMQLRIVDLPGTYGLSAHSTEERIARDFLIRERPDVVMMIADASAPERNLYLLAELLILPVPVVLGLNMTWAFLRKAGTLILLVSVVIWALSSFPGAGIEDSYLAHFGRSLAPLGEFIGLDWRMLVALLSSFVAKENAIATLAILFEAEGGQPGFMEVMAASVSPASALAFLTVTMLFVPCVATVAVMYQETRSWRWTLFDMGLLLATALIAGAAIFRVAS
jgi:Fe2+ transport system protein B